MKNEGRRVRAGLLAGAALIAGHSSLAYGQTAEVGANEIVVTANKREETLFDVSSALTAVSGDDLSYRNLVRIEDFASQVPGFSVQPSGPGQVRLILRGLNSGGSGATVGVVVDETPFSYQSNLAFGSLDTANLDTFDMARIEVLKGPQGTLYGATAEGGLLKYVTNKPDPEKLAAAVELGAETISQGNVGFTTKAMLNLPLFGGKAAIRASGFYQDVPGFADNLITGRSNANRGARWGGRISLLLNPVDDLSIRLTGSRQDQSFLDNSSVEVVGANLTPFAPTADQYDIANGGRLLQNSYFGNPTRNFYEYLNLLVNYDAGFADIVSSTSYGVLSVKSISDSTFGNVAPGLTVSEAFGEPYYGEPILYQVRQANSVLRWNQEFRLASKPNSTLFGMGFEWQIGAFYARESLRFTQVSNFFSAATGNLLTTPLPLFENRLPAKYEEFSQFGDITFHLTDRLHLSFGGRHTYNRQQSQVRNITGTLFGPGDTTSPLVLSNESKFTYSAAARFEVSDSTMVYGRIASGYRPGGPRQLPADVPVDFPRSYTADNTVNYEIGIRASAFDKALTVDLAAFRIDWTDVQITSAFKFPKSQQFFTTSNAGRARSQGLEWNIGLKPLKGLQISNVGAYTDAALTTDAPGLGGQKGDALAYVPDWSNTVNIDYEARISDTVTGFIGSSWIYTGKRYSNFGQADSFPTHYIIPAYSQFNAQAGVNFGTYSLSVYVRNIADRRALTDYSQGGGYQLTGTAQIITPRTFGIKLTAKY